MARFHLRFRDFRTDTLEATNKLFDAKPWRLATDDDRTVVGQEWLVSLASIYGLPEPRLVVGERIETDSRETRDALDRWETSGDTDDPLAYSPDDDDDDEDAPEDMSEQMVDERPVLALDHWSILLLFKKFREYALDNGVEAGANRYTEDDVHGWACSLFYKVKPIMFRQRVREGRIGRISPEDLLSTETLRRQEEERRITEEERVRVEMEAEGSAEFEDIDEDDLAMRAAHDAQITADAEEEARESALDEHRNELHSILANHRTRIELHNQAAGEDVRSMTTRPLRRYATSVGIGGVWDMSKDDILKELRESQPAAQMAQRVINATRSQTGAVR